MERATPNTNAIRKYAGHLAGSPIVWVLAAGLAIRIYSAVMRCVINPDGAQYIYQASALLSGRWSDLLACKLSYLSPLPVFIAIGFKLFGDWIVAAQVVNILFGWGVLVPLYFLVRRFFEPTVSVLTVLIFALMPVLVEGSANVIRGPIFWFCMVMGMLLFTHGWASFSAERRRSFYLLLSCLFFLLATWARIEGITLLVACPAYLLLSKRDHKLKKIIVFLSPLVLLAIAGLSIALSADASLLDTLRLKQVLTEGTQFMQQYADLDAQLKEAYRQHHGVYRNFLHRVGEIIVFIPLISILHNILEGIFYPFALIFFIGFFGLWRAYLQDRRLGFFLFLSGCSFIILYVHIIQVWIIQYRFLAVLIFPACIIFANGILNVMHYLQSRRRMTTRLATGIMITYLVLLGLPKSLKPEEQDKIVYRQAAEIIAREETAHQAVRIGAMKATRAFEWLLLYAHRTDPDISCALDATLHPPEDFDQFSGDLDRKNIHYFFYEKRYWPDGFDLLASPFAKEFRLLKQWRHPDSIELMLFKRVKAES